MTGSAIFAKDFCQHRWLENVPVTERAIEMWPFVKQYVLAVQKKDVPKPDTKSFATVVAATKDKLFEAKMNSFLSIAKLVTPFLTRYQTDRPMLPFISSDLDKLLRQILRRFMTNDVVDDASTVDLIDLDMETSRKPSSRIDVGFTADGIIKERRVTTDATAKVSERDILEFRQECRAFMQELVKRITAKAPIKYALVRNLTCLDPRKMATDSDACTAKMKRVLSVMVQNRRLSNNECDTIMGEFSDFLHDQVSLHRDKFVSFDPYSADDRLDVFSLETMDKAAYGHVWKVVAQLLLLSHGQASVERGFSVNKQMEVTNLQEDTFVAQRLVHDHITAVGGIMGVSLDKDLLRSCVASRARYQAYLDDTAKAKATDESTRKRKSVVDEIDELKSKRRQLECDLTELLKSADTYSVRAEAERNFSLVAKSNALRKAAHGKEKDLKKVSEQLDDKLKLLKDC